MKEVKNILNKFGKTVTRKAKKNIVDKKINSGGELRRSITHRVEEKKGSINVVFEMEDYGVLRDAGQLGSKRKILKGWNKSLFIPRGKGFTSLAPPPDAIKRWIRTKPIRSDLSLNTLSYLISRKIKTEGIQPGLFFSDAFNEFYEQMEGDVLKALDRDIDELID